MENLSINREAPKIPKIPEGAKYIYRPGGEGGTESVVYYFQEGLWRCKDNKKREIIPEEKAQRVLTDLWLSENRKK